MSKEILQADSNKFIENVKYYILTVMEIENCT